MKSSTMAAPASSTATTPATPAHSTGVTTNGGVYTRLMACLSVAEIIDNPRKPGSESISWKLKSVCFCQKTKKLSFLNIPGDEADYLDSPTSLKSPSTDFISASSPKNNNDVFTRSGSFGRARVDSATGLKQFISKKLAINRTRSTGKLSAQKSDTSSPKSPNRSWRSQDSDTSLDDEFVDSVLDLSDPDLSIVRPIHQSVLFRPFCIQVLTPNEMKYISCYSEEEYSLWLNSLVGAVKCNRDHKVRLDTSLSVWIIEAKGVPLRKKYFCELLLDKVLFGRTSVKYKNEMLFWGEKFIFEDLPPTESLTICLFRESDTKKKRKQEKHLFIGSSVIDLLSMETNVENEKWVSVYVPGVSPKLQQKTMVNGKDKSEQPFIRAKLKYETTVVLPLNSYNDLHKYVKENYRLLVSTLEAGMSLKIKDILAQTLLKIFQANDSAEQFLVDIIMNEVLNTADENLTFRGNSLATKSIDTYMKIVGKNYLQETLGSFISFVYENDEETEVDPQKIAANHVLSDNQEYLRKLAEDVWRNIMRSVTSFPQRLRTVFSLVRQRCEEKGLGIAKKITSASLFLRFLCPAILSPSLFQLTQEYPGERVARTLTLLAKTIQNLANFTRFGIKESYMGFLNQFVESEMKNMDEFLQSVSIDNEEILRLKNDKSRDNIDLAQALSVLYHLLQSEIPKMCKDDSEKLDDLKPILDHIASIHEVSPKVDELRLSRPFATVASVCSKPLTTPLTRDDTPSIDTPLTPSSTIFEDNKSEKINMPDCYRESMLSFNEDYVSGCSLINTHRNSPSRNLAKLNEGRGTIDRKKLHLSRNTPDYGGGGIRDGKRSKSVDTNLSSRSYDSKGKFEKLLSVSSQAALSKHQSKQMKSDQSSNSLKRRQFEQQLSPAQQKTSPFRKIGSKDAAGSIKDRISMFSNPSSPKASPNKTLMSPKAGLANKTFPQNRMKKQPAMESPSTAIPRPLKQASPLTSSKPSLLPKSSSIPVVTTTPASTPTGLRAPPHKTSVNNKPSIAKKPTASQYNIPQPKNPPSSSPSTPQSSLKRIPRVESQERPKLTLSNLRKEHNFSDCTSPELLAYERSPKRSLSDRERFSDTASSIKDDRSFVASSSRHNTLSKKSAVDDDEVSWASRLRLPLKEDFASNDTLIENKQSSTLDNMKRKNKENSPQRRYSELTPREAEKNKNFISQSQEIAQIQTNGYREVLHDGFIQQCNSISSCEYSSCDYSSESYYTSEDEMDYGEFIEGDKIEDVLLEHERTLNGDSSYEKNGTLASKMSEQRQLNDVRYLQQRLRETEEALEKTREELKNKTLNFEETVIHLKEKLVDADCKMKKQRSETDAQMKSVIARLLNIESESRNEHSEMEAVIVGKQKLVDIQERRINSLEASNARLMKALSDLKKKHGEVDDNEGEQDDQDTDDALVAQVSNDTSTPTPDSLDRTPKDV